VSTGGDREDLDADLKLGLASGKEPTASREGRRRPHLPPSRQPPESKRQELAPPGESELVREEAAATGGAHGG
jgi:hypothetical protein